MRVPYGTVFRRDPKSLSLPAEDDHRQRLLGGREFHDSVPPRRQRLRVKPHLAIPLRLLKKSGIIQGKKPVSRLLTMYHSPHSPEQHESEDDGNAAHDPM